MKMLIIKPSSLGDIIHALPFLKAVKDTFPKARIDWVISENFKDILTGNPLIDRLIVFDKDSLKKIGKLFSITSALLKELKARRYDIVVDLQGLLRSGVMTLFSVAPVKVGFADAREGSTFFYDKKVSVNKNMHAVDKCLEIAKAIGVKVSKAEFPLHVDKASKAKAKELIGNIGEYLVIVPSARWETKRWPAENFASLIGKLSIPCVIVGSKGDKKIVQEIMDRRQKTEDRRQIPPHPPLGKGGQRGVIDLCGKTDLKELVALIAGARAVVSNDSGPMHIAAALNKPLVAIFGPTDPAKTGPYGWQKNKNMKVIRANVTCGPCRKRKCREFICMEKLSAEKVFKAVKELL
ncbi:MAG: lipopolysaccharide heptosyltransferase I [Nitrospirae bacterium]|nr:lipopolysaccharide heptosyltransferase I [Nitrospirota bacterium]